MLDRLSDPPTSTPLFSVIIPLEFHRGQWERSWQEWQLQTLEKEAFEIILVVPPDFPQCEKLSELAGPTTHLEYSQQSHDIGLCAEGASVARGRYLFFTESHCWPEADVLKRCLQAFGEHTDWAGMSCSSVRVCHNRLSVAEADMYDADIAYGMNVHPWRKVLDQCFVTRRDAYEACGGFEPELGHFAEWVLAARYAARGHRIGYLPEARVHHYYIGELGELKAFTLDFVAGEISYFGRNSCEPGSELLEAPPEWTCRDNFESATARVILRMSLTDLVTHLRVQALRGIGRWALPAIFGGGVARAASAAVAVKAHAATLLVSWAGPREWLRRSLKRYIAALIEYQRLTLIQTTLAIRSDGPATSSPETAVLSQTGFYPLEQYQGKVFRWSETEAAVRFRARPGRLTIRIKCLSVRSLSNRIDLRFYLDGRLVPNGAVSCQPDGCEIRVIVPQSGTATLGWICRAFPATADPRRLGLPILNFELIS
jgi:hypothetical protein